MLEDLMDRSMRSYPQKEITGPPDLSTVDDQPVKTPSNVYADGLAKAGDNLLGLCLTYGRGRSDHHAFCSVERDPDHDWRIMAHDDAETGAIRIYARWGGTGPNFDAMAAIKRAAAGRDLVYREERPRRDRIDLLVWPE